MKELLLVVLFIIIGETNYCQNMIPNPSFEEETVITKHWSGTLFAFNRRVKQWDSPTQGSPDILFVNSLDKMFPARPKMDLSGYHPRTGSFMVGIKTFGCVSSTSHCKEYVQVKLSEPLKPGEKYFFEYWVNPIEPSVKVNSFGLGLSKQRIQNHSQIGLIDIDPIWVNHEVIDDSLGWQQIAGVFEVNDSYEYIVIGNFKPDDELKYKRENNGLKYGYYLLDDVLLRPLHQELSTNERIVLENILFEFDQAVINESSKPQLSDLVGYLKSNDKYHIEILGHADSKGSDQYNLQLSQARADAIKDYLKQKGIEGSRINTLGLGSAFPVLNNDTAKNRNVNRRVEIKIVEK